MKKAAAKKQTPFLVLGPLPARLERVGQGDLLGIRIVVPVWRARLERALDPKLCLRIFLVVRVRPPEIALAVRKLGDPPKFCRPLVASPERPARTPTRTFRVRERNLRIVVVVRVCPPPVSRSVLCNRCGPLDDSVVCLLLAQPDGATTRHDALMTHRMAQSAPLDPRGNRDAKAFTEAIQRKQTDSSHARPRRPRVVRATREC